MGLELLAALIVARIIYVYLFHPSGSSTNIYHLKYIYVEKGRRNMESQLHGVVAVSIFYDYTCICITSRESVYYVSCCYINVTNRV